MILDPLYTILRSAQTFLTRLSVQLDRGSRARMAGLEAENLDIGPVCEEDLPGLARYLGSGDLDKHRRRLEEQEAGRGSYLIARYGIPVGHLYIHWEAPDDGPLREREQKEPLMEDMRVYPAARGRGIGRLLLGRAESLARERGYRRIGMWVIVTNPPLARMYRRSGYEDPGLGPFEVTRTFTGKDGRKREWSRKVIYLVKRLDGGHEP